MPKLKTHKSSAKRFKISPNGKVIRERANNNHFLSKKSQSNRRVTATPAQVTGANERNIKRALGA